jgi:hypothetical protein|tara:strand:+ start:4656 stop:4865 length:210 start_codon:yes stop_codon:yes gene_type:complete
MQRDRAASRARDSDPMRPRVRCVRALDATTRKKTREFPSRETRACVRARAALGLDRPSSTADEGHHVSR